MVFSYLYQPLPLIFAFELRIEPVLVAVFCCKTQLFSMITKPYMNLSPVIGAHHKD
jgi:hypothetical protein